MEPSDYYVILIALAMIFVAVLKADGQQEPAIGQEIGHTHAGEVGQFYQTWKQPPNRIISCCNQTDCRPIVAMRKRRDGYGVEVEVSDYGVLTWFGVANNVWEDATADPRESPDGRGHACIMNGRVVCAVRSSDQ